MKKTFYIDDASNEILKKMPAKKQSAYVRDSIILKNQVDLNQSKNEAGPNVAPTVIRVKPTLKEVIV